MDKFYLSLSFYQRRNYEKCISICTELLEENPYDQALWTLKMRALTEVVYVDDVEAEEEGLAEVLLDTDTLATGARPGTSLRTPAATARPRSQAGRPLSGVARPGSAAARPGSLQQALCTPRSAHSARPLSAQTARTLRLGTASMLTEPGGPFIQAARLALGKYAAQAALAKPLMEYLLYHENDVCHALELAVQAAQASSGDWWWRMQLARCWCALGQVRAAEQQLRACLRLQPSIEAFVRLVRVYVRLDQPLSALDACRAGLQHFPADVALTTELARLFEGLNNLMASVQCYQEVLQQDSTHAEAIACIGMQHFYTDQPEVALRFYRHLLQMGVYSAELFNNLGLCCFYAQHYDMTLMCFEQALDLATGQVLADVWYNIAHMALAVGDAALAAQSLQLALSADASHAPAYNNLGVVEGRRGHTQQARAFFHAAGSLAPYLVEPQFNAALLATQVGDLQTSYVVVQRALQAYPNHTGSRQLLKALQSHFAFI